MNLLISFEGEKIAKKYFSSANLSIISPLLLQVKWYDGETLVDENYRLTKDTTLNALVVSAFFAKDNLISEFIWSNLKEVTVPEKYYFKDCDFFSKEVQEINLRKFCVDDVEQVYNPEQRLLILTDGDNAMMRQFWSTEKFSCDIDTIIIPSTLIPYGVLDGFFNSVNDIKHIIIVGNVIKIENRAFRQMPNLETVKIIGEVDTVSDYMFFDCPNAKLIIK